MRDEILDCNGQLIHYDKDGGRYVLDERGNKMPPLQSEQLEKSSGFTTYDSSQGHCGLCGRLTCNGSCFR